jgi:hypothetical protein
VKKELNLATISLWHVRAYKKFKTHPTMRDSLTFSVTVMYNEAAIWDLDIESLTKRLQNPSFTSLAYTSQFNMQGLENSNCRTLAHGEYSLILQFNSKAWKRKDSLKLN